MGPRRRTLSEPTGPSEPSGPPTPAGAASDTEEEDPGPEGTPPSRGSSGEGLPFAEEGNLTIKQRPKPAGPPPRETPVPAGLDFNLTESDTVKRRPKCREREPLQTALLAFGVAGTTPNSPAPQPSQTPGPVPRDGAGRLESQALPQKHLEKQRYDQAWRAVHLRL